MNDQAYAVDESAPVTLPLRKLLRNFLRLKFCTAII
jgi:hypothetical protein